MNASAWKSLLGIINGLPFPPAFVFKTIGDEADSDFLNALNTDKVYYHGDWQLNTGPGSLPKLEAFHTIEYIRIKPSFSKTRGKYASDETIDISKELIAGLDAAKIRYERDDFNNIVIYGYK